MVLQVSRSYTPELPHEQISRTTAYFRGGTLVALVHGMTTNPKNRRLTVTATKTHEFRSETEYESTPGCWTTLSTTFTTKFPLILIGRVADRADFQIYIRSEVK